MRRSITFHGLQSLPSTDGRCLSGCDSIRRMFLRAILISGIQCIFGTALTLADGIFTPAVSVTSAISGIAIPKPSVANDVIPISCASKSFPL